MNDRYLFKAKTCNGEWITGLLAHKDNKYYISNKAGMPFAFEVRPDTICQCTGLYDKEKRLIWENDVVKIGVFEYLIWWNREGQEMTAVPIKGICFNGTDYYSGCNPKFTYHDFICMMQDPYGDFINEIEVVGSIIDNPRLIEVEL